MGPALQLRVLLCEVQTSVGSTVGDVTVMPAAKKSTKSHRVLFHDVIRIVGKLHDRRPLGLMRCSSASVGTLELEQRFKQSRHSVVLLD